MTSRKFLLIPIFAVLGIASVFLIDSSVDAQSQQLVLKPLASEKPFVTELGQKDNVVWTLRDKDGNIIKQETSHNKVVTHGENCVAKMIFGGAGTAGNSVCTGALTGAWDVIQIGESATAVADGDTNLVDPADETGLTGYHQGTVAWTNSTNGSFSTVVISISVTNTGASENINEAGLFNSTTAATNGMYARVTAPSTFTVANGDTLDVNWTFETGEATVP